MDESERETATRTPAAPPPAREGRARAAAYLDLWERHVAYLAVHGPLSPAPRRPGG